MPSTTLDWSPADQAAGLTLPAPYFYDPGVFARERERIFFRSWHLVAHQSELAEPGAFVSHAILDQSVVVVAGRDGVLRAFHNVCQHRGNRLVEACRGKAALLTCRYHAWSYALDGSLRGASQTEAVAGFDRARHGLRPVRLEVFGAFVFVNLDPDARPVAEMAPGAEAELRRYLPDLDRLELVEVVDVPVAANWKVIQENSIEGYHFEHSGPAHKALVGLIDFAGYRLTPHGEYWTYIGPPRAGTTHAYGEPLAGATWQTDSFYNFGLWPNATIYAFPYADLVGTFIMNPTGPESSLLRFGYYAPRGRPLPAVTRACMRFMNQELGPEDIRLNVSNQLGLHSLGFGRGRYVVGDTLDNRGEHLVRHFHQLCHAAVRA
jgi:choline monooxygenase